MARSIAVRFAIIAILNAAIACSSSSESGGPSNPLAAAGAGAPAGAGGGIGATGGNAGVSSAGASGGAAGMIGAGGMSVGGAGAGAGAGAGTGAGGMTAGAGGDGASGTGGPVPGEPPVVAGCEGTTLYETNADDPGAFGPWPVGVKTVSVPVTGGTLTAEVWYPASFGSEAGKERHTYDLRSWLPAGEAEKIPDEENSPQHCDCYRDLPLDTAHGPYPVVVFIHGLGSFRTSSLSTTSHWASRGFIVVAADHPGDFLTDYLAGFSFGSCAATTGGGEGTMTTEADAELEALKAKSGDFAFLGSSIDVTRIAVAGHSQGGGTAIGFGNREGVQVIMTLGPLGGGSVVGTPLPGLQSILQVTGMADSVTGHSATWFSTGAAETKRHVGITGGGHIDVTDLCKEKNGNGKTGIEVALEFGVCGASILAGLAQCGTSATATESSPLIVTYATTATLEETLHCKDRSAAFAAIEGKFPDIGVYQHQP